MQLSARYFFRVGTLSAVLLTIAGPVESATCEGLLGGPGDLDGDSFLQADDCDDGDPGLWATPGEVSNLQVNDSPSGIGHTVLWNTLANLGASPGRPIVFDTLRSGDPGDFLNDPSALCLEPGGDDLSSEDPDLPAVGTAFFYLVRALNDCGGENLGFTTGGLVRLGLACDCAVLCDDGNACTADTCQGGACFNPVTDPVVQEDPTSVAVCTGSDVTFTVDASGSGLLGYQWFKNGMPVGINNPLLTLVGVGAPDDGAQISVQVTDGCAGATSQEATLTVFPDAASCTGGLAGQGAPNGASITGRGTVAFMPLPRKNGGAVHRHSGEYLHHRVDLAVPGRGLDFVWGLTYRSREIRAGRMGFQWVDSYDRRVEWEDPVAMVNLLLHDGRTSRVDTYVPDGTGCWTSPGFFRQLCSDPFLGGFVLTFADKMLWTFAPLDGSPIDGYIQGAVDRNGNAMAFTYDAAGRLTTVTDTLGRAHVVSYDINDRVSAVTDFTGRQCTYSYYQAGESGGEAGDLKSITSPLVTGTPTGNDFPQGKTTVFTYTRGQVLGELNHNLLTINDPEGNTYLRNVYTPAVSSADGRFDRLDRILVFADDDPLSPASSHGYAYAATVPSAANNFAISKTIHNDRVGNVSEMFYDASNRLVLIRRHTGRAPDPFLPTGEALNRPVGPVRPTDPPFFESRVEYNADFLLTRVVFPRGNEVQLIYDSLHPNPRLRGNMLSRIRFPGALGGDQASITETWGYTTDFGTVDLQTSVGGVVHRFAWNAAADLGAAGGGGGGGSTAAGGRIRKDDDDNGDFEYAARRRVFYAQGILLGDSTGGGGGGAVAGGKIRKDDDDNGDFEYAARRRVFYAQGILLGYATGGGAGGNRKGRYSLRQHGVLLGYDIFGAGGGGGAGAGGRIKRNDDEDNGDYYPAMGGGFDGHFVLTRGKIKRDDDQDNGDYYPAMGGSSLSLLFQVAEGSRRDDDDDNGEYEYPATGGGFDGHFVLTRGKIRKDDDDNGDFEYPARSNRRGTIIHVDEIMDEFGIGGGHPGSGTFDRHYVATADDDASSRLPFPTTYDDGRGNTYALTHDATGNLTQADAPLVSIGQGGLPPQSISHQWAYNAFGQVIQHTNPENRVDLFTYHTVGPQTGWLKDVIVDDPGLALTAAYTYDDVGNVVSVTDPRGNTTTLVRNALNQVVRVVAPAPFAYETDLHYDANDRLRRLDVQEPDLAASQPRPYLSTLYTYDALDRLVRVQDEVDETTLSCVIDELEYTPNDRVTLHRKGEAVTGAEPDNTVRATYDERDLLFQAILAESSPEVSTTQFDYDANANLVTHGQGLEGSTGANETGMTYDGYDRLIAVTDAEGNVTSVHYDANSNPVSLLREGEAVDGSGGPNIRLGEAFLLWDEVDRLVQKDVAHFDTATGVPIGDGLSTSLVLHNALSQAVRLEDDGGHIHELSYDTANRLSREIDARGNTLDYAYDASSNVTSFTTTELPNIASIPPDVVVTTLVYDTLDRRTSVTDNIGNQTSFTHDARGNLTLLVDALGNVTRRGYDGLSRSLETERDLTDTGTGAGMVVGSIVTTMEWDDSHRRTRRLDPNGNETLYEYDALDRLTRITRADGTARQRTYDAHHDAVGSSDANGTTVSRAYDRLHRLTRGTITRGPGVGGTTFEDFQYDGRSRLVRLEDDDTVVARTFDSTLNFVSDSISIDGAPPRVVSATYDGEGRRTSLTYPSGRTVLYTYDALHRVTQIAEDTLPPTPIVNYSYIGPWRLQQEIRASGVQTDHTYDAARRRIRKRHTLGGAVIADHSFGWDAVYNKVSHTDLLAGTDLQLTYDSAYRLVGSARGPLGMALTDVAAYVLDPAGNRTSVNGGPDAGGYFLSGTIPPADQQVNQYTTTPAGSRLHDENGNLARLDGGTPSERDNVYDFRNRMVETTQPGPGSDTFLYVYDAAGRRLARKLFSGGVTTTLAEWAYLGGSARPLEEFDAAGVATAGYLLGPGGEVVQMLDAAGVALYLHSDDILNVAAVTDSLGNVLETYTYGDYGTPAIFDAGGLQVPASVVGNPYLFKNERLDPETGFYHCGSGNYLDTRAGRYLSRGHSVPSGWLAAGDPESFVWNAPGLAYAGGNPWTPASAYGYSLPALGNVKERAN